MITTWSKGAADDSMPEEILVETLELVRKHPWWQARTKLVMLLLKKHSVLPPAKVIDIGCGWGTNMNALEQLGYQATGLDVSRQILQRIDRPDRRLVEADLGKELPKNGEAFDAFLALDVIEHIDDDSAALKRMAQLLRGGGIGIVSVPARPDLFSEFDRIQGHRRRYLPERLEHAFVGTGLKLESLFWWGSWMVPVLRWMRNGQESKTPAAKTYADYLRLPPWPAPVLMKLLYSFEQGRAVKGCLKTGTSLVAVARR